jgi:RsiW-degrading membrane proteinase PrsW (M82 family)
MEARMTPQSPLDNPDHAAHAWARYKRLMRFMVLITLAVIVIALVLLYRSNGFVSIHFYIATALGIGFAMLLMSALMGLVFLSSGTGHDESILDPLADEDKEKRD